MSRLSSLHLVNAALFCGVLLSVRDAVAQTQTPTNKGTLVYTACQQGFVTKCGSEPVREHCTYDFSLNLDPAKRAFGFNFGGWVCTTVGTRDLFKDYYEGGDTKTGVCIAYPRYPADGTGTAKPPQDGEEIPTADGESSC